MRWIMYFGCMKNWWLCSSSLFWFQDETLQTSNVIGQGDIFYVFDKWSLNSFKYIKIFLCWCQFTIEVLWILHVYHKVLGGFVSSKIRLPTSDLYGFFSSHKKKQYVFFEEYLGVISSIPASRSFTLEGVYI